MGSAYSVAPLAPPYGLDYYAYGERRTFCDSGIWVARTVTGRILNLSWFHFAISFANITCFAERALTWSHTHDRNHITEWENLHPIGKPLRDPCGSDTGHLRSILFQWKPALVKNRTEQKHNVVLRYLLTYLIFLHDSENLKYVSHLNVFLKTQLV